MSEQIMYSFIGLAVFLLVSFLYQESEGILIYENEWENAKKVFMPCEANNISIWIYTGATLVAYLFLFASTSIYLIFPVVLTNLIHCYLTKIIKLDNEISVQQKFMEEYKGTIKFESGINGNEYKRIAENFALKKMCIISFVLYIISFALSMLFVIDGTITTKCILIIISVITIIKVARKAVNDIFFDFEVDLKASNIVLDYLYPLTLIAFVILTFFINI